MNLFGHLNILIKDSPTFGRDRARLMSGATVGFAGLLLNGAILILASPLLANPDAPGFRTITENMEVGQLLALILLFGAAAFATLLIPLRIASTFIEPRSGDYFDQVVLSGISPLRFVIGKATSQNLFLGLILFLLLPYFVLSLALGGVDPMIVLAVLILIWMYCMMLALVTLWGTLYVHDGVAGLIVFICAGGLGLAGCSPLWQPFVMTPFPAIVYAVYQTIPNAAMYMPESFVPVFLSCAATMTVISGISLLALYLGPFYGLTQENSTFGEVACKGDSKRKRFFRFRHHIQRPSEIAFFYENRGDLFRRSEGLVRWGLLLAVLFLLQTAATVTLLYFYSNSVIPQATGRWWVNDFHLYCMIIHSIGIALGALLFSHAKNSTYQSLPFFRGRQIEVSKLDTTAFLIFLLLSATGAIASPYLLEYITDLPSGISVFADAGQESGSPVRVYVRRSVEGTLVISLAIATMYTLHRYACLSMWLRSAAFVISVGCYFATVCILPFALGMVLLEATEFRNVPFVIEWAPSIVLISPMGEFGHLFDEMGSRIPHDTSNAPFYVVHLLLILFTLLAIRRSGRKLRTTYLATPKEAT